MALTRSALREKIMIILYQIDIYKDRNIKYDLNKLIKDNVPIENEFVNDIVYGVLKNQDILEKEANKYLKEWPIDRLDKNAKAILCLAIYELKYTDTPDIVVINEAIELAKKYCDEAVRKIINAVLDQIIKE